MHATVTKSQSPSPVKSVFLAQLAAILAVAGGAFLYQRSLGYSALIGGGINLVATGYAGWRIFRSPSSGAAHRELFNIYRAEVGKLVVIGGLCAVTFITVKSLNIVAFVGGFTAAMVAGLVAAAFCGVASEFPVTQLNKTKDGERELNI